MLQCISAVVLCSAFIAACGAPPPTAVNESALDEPTSAAPSGVFVPHEVTAADIPADIQEDSWARLPTLARETLGPDGQRVFDSIVGPESRYSTGLRGPVGMWMYSPRMAEHIFPASTYLRFGADGQRDQRGQRQGRADLHQVEVGRGQEVEHQHRHEHAAADRVDGDGGHEAAVVPERGPAQALGPGGRVRHAWHPHSPVRHPGTCSRIATVPA